MSIFYRDIFSNSQGMMYHRKAYGSHRSRRRQALAADIAASILAAQQRGEHRPITYYTHHEETIRLVEEQLMGVDRDNLPGLETRVP
jgi:hypothetical protein